MNTVYALTGLTITVAFIILMLAASFAAVRMVFHRRPTPRWRVDYGTKELIDTELPQERAEREYEAERARAMRDRVDRGIREAVAAYEQARAEQDYWGTIEQLFGSEDL